MTESSAPPAEDVEGSTATSRARSSANQRTLLVGVGLAVVVVAAFVFYASLEDGAPADSGVIPSQEGQRLGAVSGAEDAPLPDAILDGFGDGGPVDVTSYRGTPLVVNFWATWCDPCVEEMPDFQEVAEQTAGRVAFLGVNVADGARRAEPFAEELGISYDLAADPDRRFFEAVQGFGMPTTLFVTSEGTVVYRHTGPLDAEGLREALRTHLDVAV
jgi:cytochrome c biogenesis protein CcmG, thiol:disulfide interchange protein DsbE